MKIKTVVTGPLAENCYIVYDEKTDKGIIIDPGAGGAKIIDAVSELKIEYFVFTHAHFDHIGAYYKVKECFPDARLIIGINEQDVLADKEKNMLRLSEEKRDIKADIFVSDGDVIRSKLRGIQRAAFAFIRTVYFFPETLFLKAEWEDGICPPAHMRQN